ncbi:hypothetical protein DLAC_04375 [Tieghemostelium lacteum]|uniref:Uncharacterized protein n=1 Tax=Tieghemostelium lacteum TaxID=361077 RepID=A0A151ZJG3_TIELA|nr:hypothetical protein DLAC_04375 [Tieghemostelium lacteum]|eukprot:KYQ94096.1 hypothetical protein DLAC_04375 [Tieghemostelium lacteum]
MTRILVLVLLLLSLVKCSVSSIETIYALNSEMSQQTFITFNMLNSTFTYDTLNNAFGQMIYGVLQPIGTDQIQVLDYNISSTFTVANFNIKSGNLELSQSLEVMDFEFQFNSQLSYYSPESNLIGIVGTSGVNNVSFVYWDLSNNGKISLYTTEYITSQVPLSCINNEVIISFYFSEPDYDPYIITTNVLTNLTVQFQVENLEFDSNSSSLPDVYPLFIKGNLYLVVVDQFKTESITLYLVELNGGTSSGIGTLKQLFQLPVITYVGGAPVVVSQDQQNIIFIGAPNGNTSEVLLSVYNIPSNINSQYSFQNPQDTFDFYSFNAFLAE